MTRQDALRELAKHGIVGADVYLIDALPLIDMMWADGKVQEVERRLLEEFLLTHLTNFNRLAGSEVLTLDRARAFVDRFLGERPDPNVMTVLTRMIPTVRFSSTEGTLNVLQKQRILDWCLDIAASCVADYPYGDHERFSAAEKACYERIINALW